MTGAEAFLLPTLMGGGQVLSMLGQRQAANERRDILNRQMARQDQAQQKASALVADEGAKYVGDERAKAFQQQEEQTAAQQAKDLGTAPTIINGAGDAGNVSGDYLTSKAQTALTEGNRLTALARELAKTRAPGQQQRQEAIRRGGLSSELQSMFSTNQNYANAAANDADSVEEPWWGQLGGAASKVALMGGGKVPRLGF